MPNAILIITDLTTKQKYRIECPFKDESLKTSSSWGTITEAELLRIRFLRKMQKAYSESLHIKTNKIKLEYSHLKTKEK